MGERARLIHIDKDFHVETFVEKANSGGHTEAFRTQAEAEDAAMKMHHIVGGHVDVIHCPPHYLDQTIVSAVFGSGEFRRLR